MPRYRRNHCEVDAWQFEAIGQAAGMPEWLQDAVNAGDVFVHRDDDQAIIERLSVATTEGVLSARPGDWLVRDPAGIFPVQAARFELDYAPIGDQAPAPVKDKPKGKKGGK